MCKYFWHGLLLVWNKCYCYVDLGSCQCVTERHICLIVKLLYDEIFFKSYCTFVNDNRMQLLLANNYHAKGLYLLDWFAWAGNRTVLQLLGYALCEWSCLLSILFKPNANCVQVLNHRRSQGLRGRGPGLPPIEISPMIKSAKKAYCNNTQKH